MVNDVGQRDVSQRIDIRQRVDQLAMDAMLAQDSEAPLAPLLAALSEIATHAEAAGYLAIPGLISEMQQSLAASPDKPDAFLAAIVRLQQAIEETPVPVNSEKPAVKPVSKPAPLPLSADPELMADFFVESRDHLTTIESQLLTLEQDPSNMDAIHSIFRGFHTIKGLAGFLEFPAIMAVAHEVETLLDKVRNGELSIAPLVDVVLEGADYLKTDIHRIEETGAGQPERESADNRALLARILAAQTPPVATNGIPGVEVPMPATITAEPDAREGERRKSLAPESRVVKVDTNKLDFLVDMVGELVIAQSMVRHDGNLNTIGNPKLQRNLSQLARITGEVQKTAMSLRMVPIGQLFQRSVRLVRDLTRKSNKRAELELHGEDTELDRTIVEDLADPLMHMIRNSADHGIEPPHVREAAGKNPVGRIRLKAYHQAGHIVIEVSDDGRGLDRDKILAKARERGLIHEGTQLSEKEVFNLIFEPGFSTAEKLTDISGRGVGMDVVRKQIQKMRGRIDIESQTGKGTTFYLKLPLTLAIIDGLVVGVGEERYIVPIYVIREMFRPNPEAIFTVEGKREMILVRGKLLPVMRLYQHFGVEPRSTDLGQSVVVVVEMAEKYFCLAVDQLIGKQEVVIKGLGETFRQAVGIAGGAILGDGRVGLILEMDGLFGGDVNG
jgi:two-component system chemotaxis sensor kinase CheA